MMLHVTLAEKAAITDACELAGAGSLVAPEVALALEEARLTIELHGMLLAGRAMPVIIDGQLRWTLTEAARKQYARRLVVDAIKAVQP